MRTIYFLILLSPSISCLVQTHEYKVTNSYHLKSAGGWDYIAVNEDKIYASHGDQVNILSEKTGDSVGIISNTKGVHGIAFDIKIGKGFTSNGKTNNVTVFDLKTNKVLGIIPTNGKNPDAILFEPYTKTIITCNGSSSNLSVIDPVKNKVIRIIAVGGKPEKAVSDGKGKVFVNIEDKNEIAVVNLKTFSVEHHWSLKGGVGPSGLEYDAETKRLFAACEKQLVVMDAESGKVIDKLPIGEGCDGVALDKKNKRIFTSNGEGTITVIKENDANSFTVLGNYPTKKGARTIAIDETTGILYLPTADFEPNTKAGKWPKMIPGTFQILEINTTSDKEKKVMLMNRIGPTSSVLFIANADGTNEHKLFDKSGFDYHASFSADGKWIVFTSERNGLGQADIYRVHQDGTGLEQLTNNPALDDQASLSPDGTQVAFVSTRETRIANIWILNLNTRKMVNLTARAGIKGDTLKPDGYFRPAWSPDGKWLAFSSDRNTEWRGHGHGTGWEHVQELQIYLVKPDGTGLRRISQGVDSVCSGSPKWSPDGKRVIFYELPVEQTWDARTSFLSARATSQIVSVDITTGERKVHTTGPGLKLLPQYVSADNNIGFLVKAGENEGIGYINNKSIKAKLRSPSWSADGSLMVYEKQDWKPRPQNLLLYSWDPNYEYRYTDVFPSFSVDGKLVVTEKDDNSSIAIMDADGSNKKRIFNAEGGEAFSPSWSPDGQWVVFGYGGYFQNRKTKAAKIMIVKRDGTGLKDLTDGTPNAGFPSWSPQGKNIVYRVFGNDQHGLRIMNVEDHSVKVLTNEYDNLPDWSPDGKTILFTRKHDNNNFDIFTITPDGKDVKQLTSLPTNDAHAVWTNNGKQIFWYSGEYGFKEEAALSDNTFQPYGIIFIMNADGSNKRPLTDSPWEDSMPCYVPTKN